MKRALPLFNGRKITLYLLAILLGVWTILPIYWLINMSFMYNVETLARPPHIDPQQFTVSNYIRVAGYPARGPDGSPMLPSGHASAVRNGLKNSLFAAVSVTILTMIIALPIAYALGCLTFRRKNLLLFGILTSRSYPPISILIPFYALFLSLGLLGQVRALVIIYLTATVPMIIWIMMGFFAQLPRTAEQEARVDGCTRFQAFYRVLLPMARPGIATAAAITFMLSWNEFAFAFILNGGTEGQTLPPVLSTAFFIMSNPTEMAAMAILSILPPAVLAFVFQRQIRRLNIVEPL
jgi:multiple sugar transport system permease protein